MICIKWGFTYIVYNWKYIHNMFNVIHLHFSFPMNRNLRLHILWGHQVALIHISYIFFATFKSSKETVHNATKNQITIVLKQICLSASCLDFEREVGHYFLKTKVTLNVAGDVDYLKGANSIHLRDIRSTRRYFFKIALKHWCQQAIFKYHMTSIK